MTGPTRKNTASEISARIRRLRPNRNNPLAIPSEHSTSALEISNRLRRLHPNRNSPIPNSRTFTRSGLPQVGMKGRLENSNDEAEYRSRRLALISPAEGAFLLEIWPQRISVSPVGEACPSGSASTSELSIPTYSDIDRSRIYKLPQRGPQRTISPAHPHAVPCTLDDLLRPAKLDIVLNSRIDRETQALHAWNPDDRSLNIFVKDDDCFTFHRHPVAQSTDCIRGKMGYSRGFHVWQLVWPQRQRGTHAVVGVATKAAALHAVGYTSLIGTNTESYGWDLTRGECHHDSKHSSPWIYPTGVPFRRDDSPIPDKFYCILDMDDGYMAFATDQHFLGVAFRNLQGRTLYPIVSAVWGHCEITMKYLGGVEPAPRPLMDICRRTIRVQMGRQRLNRVDELRLPPSLKRYIQYK